ncbi:MAG: DUF480 domain-containing protein, partial [Phycisphaerae bacterium]
LGVLIEKSLTQPAYYPMTINAIVNACNQKTNREPVTAYSDSEVSAAIATLRRREWVDQAPPERNERSIKFKHEIEAKFDWNAGQRAIMAELMLRGPQTLGELRSRAGRMTHLGSTDYARELIQELETADPPVVVELPREPGRSAQRFIHLLGGEAPVLSQNQGASLGTPSMADPPAPEDQAALERRVADLEKRVETLEHALFERQVSPHREEPL